jgi:hypothetical protein
MELGNAGCIAPHHGQRRSCLRETARPGAVFPGEPQLRAVVWPGELDLAPDAMYDAIKVHHHWVVD